MFAEVYSKQGAPDGIPIRIMCVYDYKDMKVPASLPLWL